MKKRRKLTKEDAIQIWIRKWLGHEKQQIILDFGQNPLRVYEVWQQDAFRGSREIAIGRFCQLYPELADKTDFSPHVKKRKLVSRARGADGDGQTSLL